MGDPPRVIEIDPDLLRDEEYREEIAKSSYYRERLDEVAAVTEHEVDPDDLAYFAVTWESLSDSARRPYRTAVAQAFDCVLDLERAA
jgi:hypothetical protein